MLRGNIADEVDLPEPAGLDQDVFNERRLLERLMDDRQLAGIVLQAFLQDIPSQLEDLRMRFGEHDASGIRFRVHTLKGAAAVVSTTNDTHESKTDPDARLVRKSGGHESKLAYCGNVMIENRNGLVVDTELVQPSGVAERDAAMQMAARI